MTRRMYADEQDEDEERGWRFPFNLSLLIFQLALMILSMCHQRAQAIFGSVPVHTSASSGSCSAGSLKIPAAAAVEQREANRFRLLTDRQLGRLNQ